MMKLEIRNDGSIMVEGYVNAVGRYSKELYGSNGKFIEQVEPQTFTRALEKAQNVDMLLNHDVRRKLADTATGSLELREDNIGLYARATITDDEVIAEARAGNLKGWSFGFKDNAINVDDSETVHKRTLTDIDLMEVSLLTIEPAYIATSVQVRSEDVEQRSTDDVVVTEPEQVIETEPVIETGIEERQMLDVEMFILQNK